MKLKLHRTPVALAAVAAVGAAVVNLAPVSATAGEGGRYVAGDFHNHTTCSDGSISMQKLVGKATDKTDGSWGLDWFVQAGHGGSGNRNCTLVEDATLATPAYPVVTNSSGAILGPNTTWQNSNPAVQPKGDVSGTAPNQNMWRWQALQEFQYPLMEYLNAYLKRPLFLGTESVVAGHEHTSMSVITGQVPSDIYTRALPKTAGYTALGNANALSQWQYCFDRGNTDNSRGAQNQWDCSVPGSLNAADPSWVDAAKKLVPANLSGTGVGVEGHNKTLEGLKWMKQFHATGSYYVPAHLERAGPFNPLGNNGFNIEHLRNFNNTAPDVAFGFETQPGHGASSERGEYYPGRNTFPDGSKVDSVGGTTWGGTGIYGAQIGGVWDALLGEGRNFWFFASSDWHNRGLFGPDDRRSTQDFLPGEYQRTYTFTGPNPKVNNRKAPLSPQQIVDGLRSGNNFSASGQLIDRLSFVACTSGISNVAIGKLALQAAKGNTTIEDPSCATMGQKLAVPAGGSVTVAIAVRDPAGTNYAPYSFNNPSLAQVGIKQPLNAPVLDHVDVINGLVTGYRDPANASQYAGEWPRTWLNNPDMATVPAAAKNTSAALLRTFSSANWISDPTNAEYKLMVFRITGVSKSQYLRLRGTNLPANVPWETDASGNPLPDLHTNATTTNVATGAIGSLKIPCNATGTNVPDNAVAYVAGAAPIDGCPNHLPTINGQKYVAYDIAAWSDLWFYSNPIYLQVAGSTQVAGVKGPVRN